MTGIEERVAALRARFLARAASDRTALEAAWEAGDYVEVQRVAHALAGAGGVFGFGEISRAARRVDEATTAEIEPLLADLLRLLDATS